MKIMANMIIINSQNVKLEHPLAVIIASVFKQESSVSTWTRSHQHWTTKTATG